MAYSTNPALNQKLMQLDRDYEQQKANLMQSFYSQQSQSNGWGQSNQSQPPQTNQGLNWVQGEAAARSYLVAPNTTVLLMDSESQSFYLKSTDNSGMPLPLRIFDYTERTTNTPQNAPQATQSSQTNLDDKYVTREEYSRLQAQYAEILDKLDSFHAPAMVSEDTRKPAAATTKSRGKGGDSNE